MKTVLVVDDSSSIRALVSSALRYAGFNPVEATNGKEALRVVKTLPLLDLVITDLNMPETDGISFVQKFRQIAVFKYTPVLLLTTETRVEQKDEAKAAGATGWLTKPFDPKQF